MFLNSGPQTKNIPNESFDLYKKVFVAGSFGVKGGFQIQPSGKEWFNPNRKIRDDDVQDHLDQKKSIAVIPAYFPTFATLDLDFPESFLGQLYLRIEDRVQQAIEIFQLGPSEYMQISSPRYEETRNRHIIFPVTYNGNAASGRLIKRIMTPLAIKAGIELFPNGMRKLRPPFGFKQYMIDPETGRLLTYSWEESLQWLTRMDPVDLERYPYQCLRDTRSKAYGTVNLTVNDSELIWENGLQAFGTRHAATGQLARLLYFRNLDMDTAKTEIKGWMRAKHNGYSREIAKGNWRLVNAEVDGWVDGTYAYFEGRGIYPTSIHNMQGWVTRADVDIILSQFKGDWIRQKKMSGLVRHYRGRTAGIRRWIPVHRQIWRKLGGNDYIPFRNSIVGELLEINHSYKSGAYSKRIIMRLPLASPAEMIKDADGRALTEWRGILLAVFGNPREAALASGTNIQRYYDKN